MAADTAYQNAKKNSDKPNARIEHDRALPRVMTIILKDDTELLKQFSDNESFRKWLADTILSETYASTGITTVHFTPPPHPCLRVCLHPALPAGGVHRLSQQFLL